MRHPLVKYPLLLFFVVCFSATSAPDRDAEKDRFLLEMILHTVRTLHYNQQEINDDFSSRAFDTYLKHLDYNKKFLTQSDVDELEAFRYKIDDELLGGSFALLKLSSDIMQKRIDDVEKYYQNMLSKPFDFTVEEEIELDAEKIPYAENKKELKEAWRKALKYQTLTRLHTLLEEQATKKENEAEDFEEKSLEELEAEAREKARKSNENWFKRLKQLDDTDRMSSYLNAALSTFDPHTLYFPPKDKEDFDIGISGRLEGIGATLQEKDGHIKVTHIVPGSASWRQGELKAGDVILKVAQEGEDPVDVVDMRLDHAVKLIRGPKGTKVRLTVRKLDGSIVVIPIVRDIVILEETYAKSAVVDYEGSKVGYIYLPKFYMDFNDEDGRTCADDIRKELEKLEQEDIEGVVLDLRSNGGGSLQQVVDMSGLFIKNGPIVQIKSKMWPTDMLEDKDSTITYSGPLTILVNSYSASASEILAAAMQDYQRAVVVGTPTFGKGTVQSVVGLDDVLKPGYSHYKPLGALKLTTQKFYRINGDATQIKGVTPDIVLPDMYSYLDVGEKEHDYTLPWDEVQAVDFVPWKQPLTSEQVDRIREQSDQRVALDTNFHLITENARRLKQQSETTVSTLHLKQFREEQERIKAKSKKYENLLKEPVAGLGIGALQVDMPVFEADSSKNARAEAWFDELKKDVYLKESVLILGDMAMPE